MNHSLHSSNFDILQTIQDEYVSNFENFVKFTKCVRQNQEQPDAKVFSSSDIVPIECVLDFPFWLRKQHIFSTLKKGDILICKVLNRVSETLNLEILCFFGEQCCNFHGLGMQATCELDKNTNYPGISMNSLIRCMVTSTCGTPDTFQVNVTLKNSDQSSIKLGPVQEKSLPQLYKTIASDSKITSIYDYYKQHCSVFDSSSSYDKLSRSLFIDKSKPYSLLQSIKKLNIHSSHYASQIRKSQIHRLAIKTVARGVSHFRSGNVALAMECYKAALKADPDNVEARVARGAVYVTQRDFQRAIKDFKSALELKPEHRNAKAYLAKTYFAVGKGYSETGDTQKAIMYLRDAIHYDSTLSMAQRLLFDLIPLNKINDSETTTTANVGTGRDHLEESSTLVTDLICRNFNRNNSQNNYSSDMRSQSRSPSRSPGRGYGRRSKYSRSPSPQYRRRAPYSPRGNYRARSRSHSHDRQSGYKRSSRSNSREKYATAYRGEYPPESASLRRPQPTDYDRSSPPPNATRSNGSWKQSLAAPDDYYRNDYSRTQPNMGSTSYSDVPSGRRDLPSPSEVAAQRGSAGGSSRTSFYSQPQTSSYDSARDPRLSRAMAVASSSVVQAPPPPPPQPPAPHSSGFDRNTHQSYIPPPPPPPNVTSNPYNEPYRDAAGSFLDVDMEFERSIDNIMAESLATAGGISKSAKPVVESRMPESRDRFESSKSSSARYSAHDSRYKPDVVEANYRQQQDVRHESRHVVAKSRIEEPATLISASTDRSYNRASSHRSADPLEKPRESGDDYRSGGGNVKENYSSHRDYDRPTMRHDSDQSVAQRSRHDDEYYSSKKVHGVSHGEHPSMPPVVNQKHRDSVDHDRRYLAECEDRERHRNNMDRFPDSRSHHRDGDDNRHYYSDDRSYDSHHRATSGFDQPPSSVQQSSRQPGAFPLDKYDDSYRHPRDREVERRRTPSPPQRRQHSPFRRKETPVENTMEQDMDISPGNSPLPPVAESQTLSVLPQPENVVRGESKKHKFDLEQQSQRLKPATTGQVWASNDAEPEEVRRVIRKVVKAEQQPIPEEVRRVIKKDALSDASGFTEFENFIIRKTVVQQPTPNVSSNWDSVGNGDKAVSSDSKFKPTFRPEGSSRLNEAFSDVKKSSEYKESSSSRSHHDARRPERKDRKRSYSRDHTNTSPPKYRSSPPVEPKGRLYAPSPPKSAQLSSLEQKIQEIEARHRKSVSPAGAAPDTRRRKSYSKSKSRSRSRSFSDRRGPDWGMSFRGRGRGMYPRRGGPWRPPTRPAYYRSSFRDYSRSHSRSPPRRRSPRRFDRSPPRRYDRSPRRVSRSPRRYDRSPKRSSRSPRRYDRSPKRNSRSPKRNSRSPRRFGRSPKRGSRSPRRDGRSPKRGSRSPRRYGRSPKRSSRSPRRYDRSPKRGSRSPRRNDRSPKRTRSSERSPKHLKGSSPGNRNSSEQKIHSLDPSSHKEKINASEISDQKQPEETLEDMENFLADLKKNKRPAAAVDA